jgi:hypothetical protein
MEVVSVLFEAGANIFSRDEVSVVRTFEIRGESDLALFSLFFSVFCVSSQVTLLSMWQGTAVLVVC